MVKRTPKFVVQTLIDDESMLADFARLVPASSKILDAASTFIAAVEKMQSDEKTAVYGRAGLVCNDTLDIAQQIVKEAAAISQMLRAPYHSSMKLDEASQQEDTPADDKKTVDQMSADELVNDMPVEGE